MDASDERGLARFYDGRAATYAQGAAGQTGYRRQVASFLRAHAVAGRRVLDVGCGPGNLTAALPDAVRVSGIDLSPAMIALAAEHRPRGVWAVGSFHVPFPRSVQPPFDAVVMVGAFEFCTDLRGVVARLAAATRPGGALFLGITERRGALGARLGLSAPGVPGDEVVIRLFAPDEMRAAFRAAACEPIRCDHVVGWTHVPSGTPVPYALWTLRRRRRIARARPG